MTPDQHLRANPVYWNALIEGMAKHRELASDECRANSDNEGSLFHARKAEELRNEKHG